MKSTGSFVYFRKVVHELRVKSYTLIDQMNAGTGTVLGIIKVMDRMNIGKQRQEQPT
jgi:hypothetical protein